CPVNVFLAPIIGARFGVISGSFATKMLTGLSRQGRQGREDIKFELLTMTMQYRGHSKGIAI
ncbi:hypothetical protein, partial [Shewanella sp. M-Br]|uniref:hypothetical protein n=1 Tax=Shewanella sp. M-Br TaxID=2495595 RepID=UPI0030C6E554